MRLDHTLPLFLKVLLPIVALAAITTAVVTTLALRAEHEAIQRLFEERALVIARLVGANVLEGDALESRQTAQRDLGKLIETTPVLLTINLYVTEAGGPIVWASSDPAAVYPDTTTSAWDLVAQADAAMYQAKQAGRNRRRRRAASRPRLDAWHGACYRYRHKGYDGDTPEDSAPPQRVRRV